MNYLVHLYLSPQTPLIRLGSLAGDFVKGRIDTRFHPEVAQGLLLHRRLDRFAHDDPSFTASRHRLDPTLKLYRGVLVDIFYDHFLACHWEDYHPWPLERYASEIYADLRRYDELLPEGLRRLAPKMIAGDWLVSYRERHIVALVLDRMARRSGRPALAAGAGELERHAPELEADFRAFMTRGRQWLTAQTGLD